MPCNRNGMTRNPRHHQTTITADAAQLDKALEHLRVLPETGYISASFTTTMCKEMRRS